MQETYEDFIQNILDTRGRFACGDEYQERHHIVPKSCGGGNEKENLIDLYAREHFIAHKLLALENPDNNSLVYAWWMMSHMSEAHQRDYELTAEEYEEARKAFGKSMSGENNPMYGLTGKNHPAYGRHVLEETRKRLSEINKGENHPMYGKHHSEDARKKISESLSGENHPMYGKHISEETKKKISDARQGRFAGENHPMYGKTQSDFCKQRSKEANSGYKNWHSRAIYSIELERLFWGAQDISNKFGFDPSVIAKCCMGKRKTCGKHPVTKEPLHWLYADDAIKQKYITQQDLDNYLNSLK